MKISAPKKTLLFFLSLSLCFFSSLVWASLTDKDVPNHAPPDFTPDPIDSHHDDYKRLLNEVIQQIKETNQTKQSLIQSVGNQESESEKLSLIHNELNNKILKTQESIHTETKLSQTNLTNVQQLSAQLNDKKNRLSGLVSMESTLDLKLQDLENRSTSLNQEITGVRKTNQELKIIASTPHTPGWHFTHSEGWLWSSPENYPMIYSADREGWVFYDRGSNSPWLFYDYSSRSWQAWDFE